MYVVYQLGPRMSTIGARVSPEKTPEVFICRHVETPPSALELLSSPHPCGPGLVDCIQSPWTLVSFPVPGHFPSALMSSQENTSLKNYAGSAVGGPLSMSTTGDRCAPVELGWVLHTVLPEEGPFLLLSRGSAGASASSPCLQGWSPPDQKPASLRVTVLCPQCCECTCSHQSGWAPVQSCALPNSGSACAHSVLSENRDLFERCCCTTGMWHFPLACVVRNAVQLVVVLPHLRFLTLFGYRMNQPLPDWLLALRSNLSLCSLTQDCPYTYQSGSFFMSDL